MSNDLIARLPRVERERILKRCVSADLSLGDILCESERPYRHVYFPMSGFISLVVSLDGHPPLEMGLIGSEGLLGATLVLGVNRARLRGVVQGSGTALRMSAGQMRLELRRSPALRRVVSRYLYVLLAQLSQASACTRFHQVDARLARWLLMTHDRAHADHFHLTHKFLAEMLGVQRSAITIAAGKMQRRKLISYVRGEILVLDRKGLEATSCECYEAVIEDYRQLFH
ncbi:MAG TPA: Crp/Fnr family transcriptional regulator [Steroidobacteraceae bacterium]|nr:Crp/Fnr family transcriptional regulator [Steroidobacteraceae bacterium]